MRGPLLLIVLIATVPGYTFAQAGRIERVTRGDTTIIRTIGNGLWGPPHQAVEVRRIGGESDETTFGTISVLSATPTGGVALYDSKALDGPRLRILDADGKFIRNISRQGGGPGEYGGSPGRILFLPDSGMLMFDQRQKRINLFHPDASNAGTVTFTSIQSVPNDVRLGPGGSYFVRIPPAIFGPTIALPPVFSYVHVNANGDPLDTIPFQTSGLLKAAPIQRFDPFDIWLPLPDGRVVVAASDQLTFIVRPGHGSGRILRAEAPFTRARYLPDERAEHEAVIDWQMKYFKPPIRPDPRPVVPDFKQAVGSMTTDGQGRIWFVRGGTGLKRAPRPSGGAAGAPPAPMYTFEDAPIVAGFKLDGTFLGEIQFPQGVAAAGLTFFDEYAWGYLSDKDGVPSLVKYRLSGQGR